MAERVRVMDRGMLSEKNISFPRDRKALYPMGTRWIGKRIGSQPNWSSP